MILVLGMGVTGLSVAKFLSKQNIKFIISDSRESPLLLNDFLKQFPNKCKKLDNSLLENITKIVVSPGIDLQTAFIQLAIKKSIQIIGDMDLFFEAVTNMSKPVIGITGTNGKSTVTTLITKMINDSGLKAVMGGNIGTAALDILEQDADFYVLELSSYQLDLTKNMHLFAAVVLNIAPDHLDRYATFEAYVDSKLSIYDKAKIKIVNSDDANVTVDGTTFSLGINANFARVECHGSRFLLHNDEVLLNVNDLNILGEHNHSNVLAALALGHNIGLDKNTMLKSIKSFFGLKHRLQKVTTINQVDYFNDSKATNTDATIVAIKTLKEHYDNIVLILGGVAKEKDYQLLAQVIKSHIKTVVLIGQSTELFLDILQDVKTVVAKDMTDAVTLATQKATKNTAVLLSPACASFDMFKNFEHRGDVFIEATKHQLSE